MKTKRMLLFVALLNLVPIAVYGRRAYLEREPKRVPATSNIPAPSFVTIPKLSEGPVRKDVPPPSQALERFTSLHVKTLRNKSEELEYQRHLTNKAELTLAKQRLTQVSAVYTTQDEKQRMEAVDLLTAALAWRDNPQRDEVKAMVAAVLLDDGFVGVGEDQYKSVAGDRLELFGVFVAQFGEEAEQLIADAPSEALRKIFHLSKRLHSDAAI
jgi:hypothetical protein